MMRRSNPDQPVANQPAPGGIPTFQTVEEEAAFWDAHSSMDFADELEAVVDVQFVPAPPKKAITVRLEDETLAALTRQARERGIGPSTLVRMWILERLRDERRRPPHVPSR